ncbi:MAG: TolC family protein [Nannocystales bacterium]
MAGTSSPTYNGPPQSSSTVLDVQLPSSGTVTLRQVSAHAQQHAAELLIARARANLGEAEREAASLLRYDPVVVLGLGTRGREGAAGLEVEVAVSQRFEFSGQRRARIEAARQLQLTLAAAVEVAAWAVHADVHLAFSTAQLAQEELILAQQRQTLAETLEAMAAKKVAEGEESGMALNLAKAEVAWSRNACTRAEAKATAAYLSLARAAGVSDRALRPEGAAMPSSVFGDRAAWGLEDRGDSPQVARANAAVGLAEARVRVAQRNTRPAPTLGVRVAREGASAQRGSPNPAPIAVMGTVALAIPAFRGGRGEVARRTAEAEVTRAERRVLLQELDTLVRVASVHADASWRRSLRLQTDVVAIFDDSLEALQSAYEAGEEDFSSVARSMQRLWTVREQVLSVRAEYHVALAELELLVGPIEPVAGVR